MILLCSKPTPRFVLVLILLNALEDNFVEFCGATEEERVFCCLCAKETVFENLQTSNFQQSRG